ncbi:MAG: hypothetical protein IPH68_06660 [Chitinophagaceae bacterium]|nr:hypothetical protein [Chitinophagaceae bacterium]
MKLLKKFSLVYSLQIMAVIMLFFFPGFSTPPEKVETNTGKPGPGHKVTDSRMIPFFRYKKPVTRFLSINTRNLQSENLY